MSTSGTKGLGRLLLHENGGGMMEEVVIEVNKGTVTRVYSDAKLRFVVLDWDLRERIEPGGTLGSEIDRSSLNKMSQETLNQYRRVTN